MPVKANLKYVRISPRKARLVVDLIRGRSLMEAEKILKFTIKRSAKPILKLLESAAANAEHNFNLNRENLYIAEIKVDGGPTLKRFRPRARGSVSPIHKRTSHIFVRLQEYGETEKVERKGKRVKIEKVKQKERPKEDVSSKESTRKTKSKKRATEQPERAKKQVFRRKAM